LTKRISKFPIVASKYIHALAPVYQSVEATKLPITVIFPRNVSYRGSHFFNIPLNFAVTGRHADNTLFKINKKEHASPINSGLISMSGVLNIKNV
jgi:hypothetical protein